MSKRAAASTSAILIRLMLVAVLLLAASLARPVAALAGSYTWTGDGDQRSFGDSRNWSPKDVPEADDEVSIRRRPGGFSTLDLGGRDVTLAKVTQGEGSDIIGGSLTLAEGYDWTGGELHADVTLGEQSTSRFSGRDEKRLMGGSAARFVNKGTLTVSGDETPPDDPTVRVWDVQITNTGTLVLEHGAALHGLRCCLPGSAQIHNTGRLAVIPDIVLPVPSTIESIGLDTTGTVDVRAGTLALVSAPHRLGAGSRFTGLGRTLLSGGSAALDGAVSIGAGAAFELADGGQLTGKGAFSGGEVRWTGGEIVGEVTTSATTTLRISGASQRILRRGGTAAGTLVTEGATVLDATGLMRFAGDAVFRNRGTLTVTAASKLDGGNCCTTPARLENHGTLVIDPGTAETVTFDALAFTNAGTVRVASGTLQAILLPYLQTDGTTELIGGTLAAREEVQLRGGRLRGAGTIRGAVHNDGVVAPGGAGGSTPVGTLRILGAYRQGGRGQLVTEIKGTAPGTGHDQLAVEGAVTLAGTLEINSAGFSPAAADRFAVIASTAPTGTFATLAGAALPDGRRFVADYLSAGVILRAGAGAGGFCGEEPSPRAARSAEAGAHRSGGARLPRHERNPAGTVAFEPQPNPRITIRPGVTADDVQVELKDYRDPRFYVPYTGNCASAALATVSAFQKAFAYVRPLYARRGGQPGLRTYDRRVANNSLSGAIDAWQTDLRWNTQKVRDTVDYIKAMIDEGLPMYVGVNESGKGQDRRACPEGQPLCDPARQPPLNDGVTDHFLVVAGYTAKRVGGAWEVTELLAIDNAATGGQTAPEAYPVFTVTPGAIRKPATTDRPERAEEFEYQLSQLRIYEKDLAEASQLLAWWP